MATTLCNLSVCGFLGTEIPAKPMQIASAAANGHHWESITSSAPAVKPLQLMRPAADEMTITVFRRFFEFS
jgi:hypothetical protein